MDEELLESLRDDMNEVIEKLQQRLKKVRTGRASVGMLDSIRVEYYGSPTPVAQMATVAVPEPRMLTISPWDKTVIPLIEKAILKSDLGLTPSSDGKLIRLNVPELTGERRSELVRSVKKLREDARVGLRSVRREYMELVKSQEKAKEISEDDERRAQDKIQSVTDDFVAKADATAAKKEAEIMED